MKIHCVIRSIGERTLDVCKYSLINGGFNPAVVTGAPFYKTLEKAFQSAIDSNTDYTVMVDADVVTNYKIFNIDCVKNAIKHSDKDIILFFINDFIFQMERMGGVRIYKNEILNNMITQINPSLERPEGFFNRTYGFYEERIVVGNHGYDQYYRDIWRTCFLHGSKSAHLDELKKSLEVFKDNPNDSDFLVASNAIISGSTHDKSNPAPGIKYSSFGIFEKQSIKSSEFEELCLKSSFQYEQIKNTRKPIVLNDVPQEYQTIYDSILEDKELVEKIKREDRLQTMFNYINEYLVEIKRGGLKILDLGTGPGYFLECSQYYDNEAVGVDIVYNGIDTFFSRYNMFSRINVIRQKLNVIYEDVNKWIINGVNVFGNKKFDVINSQYSMHHILKNSKLSVDDGLVLSIRKMVKFFNSIITEKGIVFIMVCMPEDAEYSKVLIQEFINNCYSIEYTNDMHIHKFKRM